MNAVNLFPEDWLESLRLKLACQQWLGTNPRIRRVAELATLLNTSKLPFLCNNSSRLGRLKGLQISTLYSLQKVDLSWDISDLDLDVNKAVSSLEWSDKSQTSPVAGSWLAANRIGSGQLSPPEVIRLSMLEGRWKLRSDKIGQRALKNLIDVFKEQAATSFDRLKAISEYEAIAGRPSWNQIQNTLINNQVTWILFSLKPPQGGRTMAVPLPITLDVKLGTKGSLLDNVDLKYDGPTSGLIDEVKFRRGIERARVSASDLWRSKATAWPLPYQQSVANCRVSIDLSIAQSITAPLAERYGWRFMLEGESHGAAIALSIMSHFVDRMAIEGVCATGVIGDRVRDRDDNNIADRKLVTTYDIQSKINTAAEACFDKCLVVAKEGRGIRDLDLPDNTNVIESKNNMLSDFADEVFGQQWRRHTYVRCPDVASKFKAVPTAKAKELKRILSDNGKTVLKLSNEYSATDVAQALKGVNDDVRDTQFGRFKVNSRLGSFAFFRVVPYEMNERFWWSIWSVLGGSLRSFDEFRFGSPGQSESSPSHLLSRALNRFTPKPATPRRVPDILVILGADLLEDNQECRLPGGPSAKLRPKKIFKDLSRNKTEGWVLPSRTPNLTSHIGKTRVILLDGGGEIERNRIDKSFMNANDYALLSSLSTYNFGFTLRQASRVLKLNIHECQEILKKFQALRTDGNAPVVTFTPATSEYYLNVTLENDSGRRNAAIAQLRTAESQMGYLGKLSSERTMDFRDAFFPWNLHEAQEHLNQARRLSGENHKDLWRKASQGIQRVSNIGEPFGWSRVMWSLRFEYEDNPALLRTLVEHVEKYEDVMHPLEWLLAAKYFKKALTRAEKDRSRPKTALEELERHLRIALYQAGEACEKSHLKFSKVRGENESDAARFSVEAARMCLVLSKYPGYQGVSRAKKYIASSQKVYSSMRELDDMEWFEYMGDTIEKPSDAIRWYREGLWNPSLPRLTHWHRVETLVKFLGTCVQLKHRPDKSVLHLVHKLSEQALRRVSANPSKSTGIWQFLYVRDRCKLGRLELQRLLDLRSESQALPTLDAPSRSERVAVKCS